MPGDIHLNPLQFPMLYIFATYFALWSSTMMDNGSIHRRNSENGTALRLSFTSDHKCEWRTLATEVIARLEDIEKRSAFEDPDSGLGNKRQFERDIIRMTARQQRIGAVFSIVIIEARHLTGSATALDSEDIDDIARELLDTIRLEDHVSRLNAFQFGVVLEGAGLEGATGFAERICAKIASSPFARPGGAMYMEMSAGAAESSEKSHGVLNLRLVAEADLKRYQSKVRGQRDRFANRVS